MAGYDAWYEMYPLYPVTIDMAVHAGDSFTGTVTWTTPASFTLSLVNNTTGKKFTHRAAHERRTGAGLGRGHRRGAEQRRSATSCRSSDFSLVAFSDCAFDGQPISAYDWNQIDMASEYNDSLVDRTSELGADGASFTVTTDVTPPVTTVTGAGEKWHSKAVTLRFHATDNPGGQGVAYTEYSLDGGVTWAKGDSVTLPAPRDHSKDGAQQRPLPLGRQGGQRREEALLPVCASTRAGRRPSPSGRRSPLVAAAPPCASMSTIPARAARRRR